MKLISNLKKGVLQLVAIATLVGVGIALPQAASANSGAGATILNVVTVNYKDAGGVTSYAETATSTVTVTLVKSSPTVSAPIDQTVASGATATYAYTVTATANGSDAYPIASTVGATTNATGTTATPSVATLTLGASVITAVPTASSIEVPAGSETNLTVSDVVVVDGYSYLITAITPGTAAAHTNASTTDGIAGNTVGETPTVITLGIHAAGSNVTPAFTTGAASPLIGTVAGEQGTFTVAVTGNAGPGPGDGTVPVTVEVGPPGGPGNSVDPTSTTLTGANLSITKEVSTDGGATFAATGSGAPGDTLTYRITVTNNGAGNATSVIVTDPMPLYTTYTAGTAKLATVAAPTYAAGTNVALTDAAGAEGAPAAGVLYDYNITTATTSTMNVGTLAAAAVKVLLYQVTID